jgi:hypothetical protein
LHPGRRGSGQRDAYACSRQAWIYRRDCKSSQVTLEPTRAITRRCSVSGIRETREIAKSPGGFFFVWILWALGGLGGFTLILSAIGLWDLRR